jgi:hypothetical protein
MRKARGTQWTSEDLWAALEEFKRELEAAGLRANSIDTYVGRTTIFLRWLEGDYTPRARRKPEIRLVLLAREAMAPTAATR